MLSYYLGGRVSYIRLRGAGGCEASGSRGGSVVAMSGVCGQAEVWVGSVRLCGAGGREASWKSLADFCQPTAAALWSFIDLSNLGLGSYGESLDPDGSGDGVGLTSLTSLGASP